MMLLPFRRPGRNSTIRALYGMIVAQARSPVFYAGYGVPDTVPGRIEMIMLHLALVLRRLREDATAGRQVQQELFDWFCQDMDDNFREMGVGDLTVPKEMKRIAEAFYGRAKAYDAALDAQEQAALTTALARNVFGGPAGAGAARLATYIMESRRRLSEQPAAAVLRSESAFADPDLCRAPDPVEGLRTMTPPDRKMRSEQPQGSALWSVRVAASEVPETGQHHELVADDAVQSAVAASAGVNGVAGFKASFDVTRHGRGGLHVTGEVSAAVDQTCVATLEPLRNEIREPIDLIYLPPDEAAEGPASLQADVDEASLETSDPPEILTGGGIDLGAIAVEFLTLGIDPYPRKPGAAFDAPPAADDPADKPFAALAALRPPAGDKKP